MRIDLDTLLRTGTLPGAEGCLDHRHGTVRRVVALLARRPPAVLVETGCQSNRLLSAHGMSTTIFGALAERHHAVLHTVDIDADKMQRCRELTGAYAAHIRYTVGDSVAFLSEFQGIIDFLYLDSYDFSPECGETSRGHQLAEIRAAHDKLGPGAVVLLDDANVQRYFHFKLDALDAQGKTPYAHRFLLERGAVCLVDYPNAQRLYVFG